MREVKFYKKSYPIIGSGNCVIIFKDELHNDVFYTLASYLGAVASKRIPEISDTSKLMYAFIKIILRGKNSVWIPFIFLS